MTLVRWMYHEVDSDDIVTSGMAWGSPESIEETMAEFAELGNQTTRVNMLITCCVVEVIQTDGLPSVVFKGVDAAASASLTLQVSSESKPSASDDACLSADTNCQEACSDTLPLIEPLSPCVSSDVGSSPTLTSLAALRFCLARGEPETAMARWMFDDAGMFGSKWAARQISLRWSKWKNLQSTMNDLERVTVKKDKRRPVRIVVSPDAMTSFMMTADNAAETCVALRELLDQTSEPMGRVTTANRWEIAKMDRQDSFMSCEDLSAGDDHGLVEGIILRNQSSVFPAKTSAAPRETKSSTNPNKISHFAWLRDLLDAIATGTTNRENNGKPLFVVAGACPNNFCGMQAVLYSHIGGKIDFWWVKPQAKNANILEPQTLNRHAGGPFKNTAASSKKVYAPLAEKFNNEGIENDNLVFGVDEAGRAYIEESRESDQTVRMLLYFVWQESWSSLMSRKQFLEGKLFYQLCSLGAGDWQPNRTCFFARQYRIESGGLTLAPWQDEEEVSTLLPPDSAQDMYIMTAGGS